MYRLKEAKKNKTYSRAAGQDSDLNEPKSMTKAFFFFHDEVELGTGEEDKAIFRSTQAIVNRPASWVADFFIIIISFSIPLWQETKNSCFIGIEPILPYSNRLKSSDFRFRSTIRLVGITSSFLFSFRLKT